MFPFVLYSAICLTSITVADENALKSTLAPDVLVDVRQISASVDEFIDRIALYSLDGDGTLVEVASSDGVESFENNDVAVELEPGEHIVHLTQSSCTIDGAEKLLNMAVVTTKPRTISVRGSHDCPSAAVSDYMWSADIGSFFINVNHESNAMISSVAAYNPSTGQSIWLNGSTSQPLIDSLDMPDASEFHTLGQDDNHYKLKTTWSVADESRLVEKGVRSFLVTGFFFFESGGNEGAFMSCFAKELTDRSCNLKLEADVDKSAIRSYSHFCVFPLDANRRIVSEGTCHRGESPTVIYVGKGCGSSVDCFSGSRCLSKFQGVDSSSDTTILPSTFPDGTCNIDTLTNRLCYKDDDCESDKWTISGTPAVSCVNKFCSDVTHRSGAMFYLLSTIAVMMSCLLCCICASSLHSRRELPAPLTVKSRSFIPSFRQMSTVHLVTQSDSESDDNLVINLKEDEPIPYGSQYSDYVNVPVMLDDIMTTPQSTGEAPDDHHDATVFDEIQKDKISNGSTSKL
eukprot:GHVH01006186.1.p1 GENE.GHVH01006186.1~~GHVH01006186.1.p1  ORF type:complete len:515 (+),score=71.80 GHVH01006186.1:168-1712(+)